MRRLWRGLATRLSRLGALSLSRRLKVGLAAGVALVVVVGLLVVLDQGDSRPVRVAVANESSAFRDVTTTEGATTTTSAIPSGLPATTTPAIPVTVTATTSLPPPAPAGTTEFVATGNRHVISADGRFVAYSAAGSESGLYLRDVVGGVTELISGPGRAWGVSQDGRYVAFASMADDLVPGDTNDETDVFVVDRVTRSVERVSVTSTGGEASGEVAAMSADGRYVVFLSSARTLAPDGNFHSNQVYVRDRVEGTTTLVSDNAQGKVGTWNTSEPVISADGRVVAFTSLAGSGGAPNVDGSTRPTHAVFAVDLATDHLERVSPENDQFDQAWTSAGSLSADGRWVAFSASTPVVPGYSDVYLHDRQSGAITQLTRGSAGANGSRAAISADGRRVVFLSTSASHVPGDTNHTGDVFVMDVPTRAVRRASVSSAGEQSNNQSGFPAISADGRSVFFSTMATNLAPGATSKADILVRRLPD